MSGLGGFRIAPEFPVGRAVHGTPYKSRRIAYALVSPFLDRSSSI
jgi:hypothetical protein